MTLQVDSSQMMKTDTLPEDLKKITFLVGSFENV